jgi:hypothetical protein
MLRPESTHLGMLSSGLVARHLWNREDPVLEAIIATGRGMWFGTNRPAVPNGGRRRDGDGPRRWIGSGLVKHLLSLTVKSG